MQSTCFVVVCALVAAGMYPKQSIHHPLDTTPASPRHDHEPLGSSASASDGFLCCAPIYTPNLGLILSRVLAIVKPMPRINICDFTNIFYHLFLF